jgi:hypothetical protein
MHFQWNYILDKQTSGTRFQWRRPQILSGYWRRFRLQYRTGNREVEVDLLGLLGMCIPTCMGQILPVFKTKGHPSNIHTVNRSGWAWPIRLQFWKVSSLGFSDVCLIWQKIQKMFFKTVSLSGNCRLRKKVAGRFFVGSEKTNLYINLDHLGVFKPSLNGFSRRAQEPKTKGRGVPTAYSVDEWIWAKQHLPLRFETEFSRVVTYSI